MLPPNDSSPRNRVSAVAFGTMNIFSCLSMFVVFVAQLFKNTSTAAGDMESGSLPYVALALSVVFAVLCLISRKLRISVLSMLSLMCNIATCILLFYLVRWNAIFFMMVWLTPSYMSVCANKYVAFTFTVVVSLSLSVLVIFSGCDLVTSLTLLLSMLLSYVICQLFYALGDVYTRSNEGNIAALQQSVDKKQEFISKLSHRIRTPLSNILGITNILGDTDGPGKKQLIDSLIASVKTITDIVEVIDEESDKGTQPESENEEDEISSFDLAQLITQLGEFTQNLEVKLEVYGQLPRLKGNAVKIRRIFLNIFDFFLQNTPKESLPANITIVVNRVRIPINPIKYRFDIKSDITLGLQEDSDIPQLTIAKRLIENLNGNIKRRFEEDLTCIYFNICFDGEEDSRPISNTNIEVHTNETTGFSSVVKGKDLSDADVIVCDDNPINQKVMSLSLEKHVKSITLASNGQECVDLVTRNSFDLVLMDIQMPILDGYGATQQIRQMETNFTNRHIPIIAVTANTLAGDKQHCLSVGMDDYVSKPFQLDDVLAKMRALVGKYPQG